ncbi:MAG: recombinase zinc beta ribbon domain-containing protein, partial [Candidatus Omnitrophota bacterium]
GLKWRTSSLQKILSNTTYIGVTYYNKYMSVEVERTNGYKRIKNTGQKLRPKSEWIAIPLPKETNIIDKNTFDAVQKQLKRNSQLSPRNTKHKYLLRGIMYCGNCDSPFGGDTCHGKLYYRCRNRTRTFPDPRECKVASVASHKVEGAVWDKLKEALKNPALITDQMQKLSEKAKKNKPDMASIDKDIKKTEDEENRLLDAYRTNIVSIKQLKDQMEKIQGRKDELEQSKAEASKEPIRITKSSIVKYCKQIASRLDHLDFEGKRFIVTTLVNSIHLADNKALIKGVLSPIASMSSERYDFRLRQLQARVLYGFGLLHL